jgi:hypothetical protein
VSERADPRPQGVAQDVGRVLQNGFYTGSAPSPTEPLQEAGSKRDAKPSHYKVICISMYTRDIEELEAKVAELKRRGWTKASKSQLIRLALSQIDLDKLATPRQ